jgi:alcohol dehydrogenase (cytochrome c)
MAKPYVKQTWAKEIDDRGRPVRLPNTFPTIKGTPVWPGVTGGMNWFSPSYSPTGLVYVAAQEEGNVYFTAEATYKPGANFTGGGGNPIPGERGAPARTSGISRPADSSSPIRSAI